MKFLSTQEAADQLKLTPRRVQALCKQGRLGQRVGGRYIITQADLDKFKAQPRKAGRPKAS